MPWFWFAFGINIVLASADFRLSPVHAGVLQPPRLLIGFLSGVQLGAPGARQGASTLAGGMGVAGHSQLCPASGVSRQLSTLPGLLPDRLSSRVPRVSGPQPRATDGTQALGSALGAPSSPLL